MVRRSYSRAIGVFLVVVAAAGMLISIILLLQVWTYRPVVTKSIQSDLDLVSTTITTTTEGLALLQDTIHTTGTNVEIISNMTISLSKTLQDSRPVFQSLDKLTGQDLPTMINSTQLSLSSAQTSSGLIDNFLGTIARVPFLGLGVYQPDIPLSTSLGQVSDNLEKLKPTLLEIQGNLTTAQSNLDALQSQISTATTNVALVREDLRKTEIVITQYQDEVDRLRSRVESARSNVESWGNRIAWLLTIILVWAFFAQVSMLIQGLDRLNIRL